MKVALDLRSTLEIDCAKVGRRAGNIRKTADAPQFRAFRGRVEEVEDGFSCEAVRSLFHSKSGLRFRVEARERR